jgi:hypothetical protein
MLCSCENNAPPDEAEYVKKEIEQWHQIQLPERARLFCGFKVWVFVRPVSVVSEELQLLHK